MEENDWLAERFEELRAHLRAVAHRMLGSLFADWDPNRRRCPQPQADRSLVSAANLFARRTLGTAPDSVDAPLRACVTTVQAVLALDDREADGFRRRVGDGAVAVDDGAIVRA